VARLTRALAVAAVLCVLGATAAPRAGAQAPPTRWAYPAGDGWARTRPEPAAPRVQRRAVVVAVAGAAVALAVTPVAQAGSSSQPTRLVTFVA
jgi:hypothetical protein